MAIIKYLHENKWRHATLVEGLTQDEIARDLQLNDENLHLSNIYGEQIGKGVPLETLGNDIVDITDPKVVTDDDIVTDDDLYTETE